MGWAKAEGYWRVCGQSALAPSDRLPTDCRIGEISDHDVASTAPITAFPVLAHTAARPRIPHVPVRRKAIMVGCLPAQPVWRERGQGGQRGDIMEAVRQGERIRSHAFARGESIPIHEL